MNIANEAALFPSTQWSVVEAAIGSNADASKQAIDTLFATYWKPIYGYIRHLGRSEQDAEDLTQEFFKQMMVRRNLFLEVRQDKGKLRTYVCFAVKRMVATSVRNDGRLKREGDKEFLPIDTAECASIPEHNEQHAPDRFFDRQWAAAIMNRTLVELEAEYAASCKGCLFQELRPLLTSETQIETETASQGSIAERLGMTVGAFRMALTRMRRRFGCVFRRNVERTLLGSAPDEVNSEIAYLIELSRN